tara:strand:- start:2569 stop:2958 length:390 start_codon:yes stop_codon:yes gene_type:complete
MHSLQGVHRALQRIGALSAVLPVDGVKGRVVDGVHHYLHGHLGRVQTYAFDVKQHSFDTFELLAWWHYYALSGRVREEGLARFPWKSVPLIIFCVALLLLRSAAYGLLATPSDEEGTVLLVDIQVSRAR